MKPCRLPDFSMGQLGSLSFVQIAVVLWTLKVSGPRVAGSIEIPEHRFQGGKF